MPTFIGVRASECCRKLNVFQTGAVPAWTLLFDYGLQERHLSKAIVPEDAPSSQHPARILQCKKDNIRLSL